MDEDITETLPTAQCDEADWQSTEEPLTEDLSELDEWDTFKTFFSR